MTISHCNPVPSECTQCYMEVGCKFESPLYTTGGIIHTVHPYVSSFKEINFVSYFSNCVNLDITTMIAYVSSLTNGGCGYVFKVHVHVMCIC